jgi:multicomponent Na+:H+ antiporter subunit B
MNGWFRLALFAVGAAALALFVSRGLGGLPAFGECESAYRDYLNAHAVRERHSQNLPTVINFDYRGIDTIGEEYILFVSVIGIGVLLREPRRAKRATPPHDAMPADRSLHEPLVHLSGVMAGMIVVVGIYVVVHAQLTPGGGFQGGAIVGAGLLTIYLAHGHEVFARLVRKPLIEAAEAVGAGGYVVIGLAMLAAGGAFLENLLPLGQTGTLLSAGTVPLINLAVGLEVSAGFAALFIDFISESHRSAEETGA